MEKLGIFLILFFAVIALSGCEEKKGVELHLNVVQKLGVEKIIAVEPGETDSVKIIYKDKNGYYYSQLVGKSKTFSDGTQAINPADYLFPSSNKKNFGSLPGQETEYKKYMESEYRQ